MKLPGKQRLILSVLTVTILLSVPAAGKKQKTRPAYRFTHETVVEHTSVKDQYRTGTCWVFATLSFLESELLRQGRGEMDLSEMFVARHAYPRKALNYIRLHGMANFGPGGQSHDVLDVIKEQGIVPEYVYPGMTIAEKRHNHGEMSAVLKGILDALLQLRGTRLTPRWMDAFTAVLDVYLGEPPGTFNYRGNSCSPQEFARDILGLRPDDYLEITSYNHHPFYEAMRLEVPDNWTFNNRYLNVPVDVLEKIVDNGLSNGYSVAWDADVSEPGFSPENKEDLDIYDRVEYAVVPLKRPEEMTEKEKQQKYTAPVPEKEISQEMRQRYFDNFTTTDDHLMHIVGIARDQRGEKFYLVKNSRGTDRRYKGYQYVSRAYFRLHTICITIHKDALSADVRQKIRAQQ